MCIVFVRWAEPELAEDAGEETGTGTCDGERGLALRGLKDLSNRLEGEAGGAKVGELELGGKKVSVREIRGKLGERKRR